MVFILVNNNYHLLDLEPYLSELDGQSPKLIKVPHTLSLTEFDAHFDEVIEFAPFHAALRNIIRPGYGQATFREIRERIKPEKHDVLIVFTDYEVVNQYIISLFHENGARVVMLEDGMATVSVGNLKEGPVHFKTSIVRWILRNKYGMKYLNILEGNNFPLPVISDMYVDVLGLSIKAPLLRNIPVCQLRPPVSISANTDNDAVQFINQDLYNLNLMTMQEYREALTDILTAMTRNFLRVIFKCHPREKEEDIAQYQDIIAKFPSVTLVKGLEPIEAQAKQYMPRYNVSFYSSALKSLYFKGAEPLYVFHLIPSLWNSAFGKVLYDYLHFINYKFINSFDDIKSGYHCNITLDKEGKSLTELLYQPLPLRPQL